MPLFHSYDPEMGWRKLAKGGVEVKMIAGTHRDFLEQPYVLVLAAKLTESLEGARSCGSLEWPAAHDKVGP